MKKIIKEVIKDTKKTFQDYAEGYVRGVNIP